MVPKTYKKYYDESIISNNPNVIRYDVANEIKWKELYSSYTWWNFYWNVWYENWKWNCEVWTYGYHRRTYTTDTLEDMMEEVSEWCWSN